MNCALSENQQRALRKKIAKNLLEASLSKEPFDVKSYIRSVYEQVKDKSQDEELALGYASMVPFYVDQVKSVDREMSKALREKGVSFDDLADLATKFEDDKKGLENVREYLGLNVDVVKEVREQNEALKREEEMPEEKPEEVSEEKKRQ